MIVDSSALVAIALDEATADLLREAIVRAGSCVVSAATLVEASIVIDSRGNPVAVRLFDELTRSRALTVVPFTPEHAQIARQAYRDFGRGSGHPANLNYGDCFSYALAAERREPLLYVGDDFSHTDIRSALAN
ncbi:type II toxin-antitoxin system VapC family toxin [Microbacterium lacus]|uniref:type II toxin-antitoxin system VapC family toxin n=1 Tax=Microbacterium lacus TaxID=415217 RepID=UPI00384AC02F